MTIETSDGVELPEDTPFAEDVPKKGASCATCDWLSDEERCTHPLYVKVHGSGELGNKPKKWCCVVWTPVGGR